MCWKSFKSFLVRFDKNWNWKREERMVRKIEVRIELTNMWNAFVLILFLSFLIRFFLALRREIIVGHVCDSHTLLNIFHSWKSSLFFSILKFAFICCNHTLREAKMKKKKSGKQFKQTNLKRVSQSLRSWSTFHLCRC